MCTCNLSDIQRECGRNAPGLTTQVNVACVDDVASIGAATGHAVAAITMAATKTFFTFNITRKDNSSDTSPNENGGYTTELKGFISKKAAAKAAVLTNIPSDENFVVLATDQNGYTEILGSLAHPVKINVKSTVTPKNGYEVTVTWEEHADLPYQFTGDISALL